MKKLVLGITLTSLLVYPVIASAQVEFREVEDLDAWELLDALDQLIDWLFSILVIVSVIFLIVAAFTFVTASGDPEKFRKARMFVIYGLIGVAVATASWGLVNFVIEILSGP